MNTDTVLRFAKLLEVDPTRIDPSLAEVLGEVDVTVIKVLAPVIGSLTGETPNATTIDVVLEKEGNVYAVLINQELAALPLGGHLVADPENFPVADDLCVVRMESGELKVATYVGADQTTFILRDPTTEKPFMLHLKDVIQVDPVVAIHQPERNRPRRLHPKVHANEN